MSELVSQNTVVVPVDYDRFTCPDCGTLRSLVKISIENNEVKLLEKCDKVRCPGGTGYKTRIMGNNYNSKTHGIYDLDTQRVQFKPGKKPRN